MAAVFVYVVKHMFRERDFGAPWALFAAALAAAYLVLACFCARGEACAKGARDAGRRPMRRGGLAEDAYAGNAGVAQDIGRCPMRRDRPLAGWLARAFVDRPAAALAAVMAAADVAGGSLYVDNTFGRVLDSPADALLSVAQGVLMFLAFAQLLHIVFEAADGVFDRRLDSGFRRNDDAGLDSGGVGLDSGGAGLDKSVPGRMGKEPQGAMRKGIGGIAGLSRRLASCFPAMCAAIFLSRVPAILAYWPGIFSYDVLGTRPQGVEIAYTSFHPPLYTAFQNGLAEIGSALFGGEAGAVALTSIVQSALLSCVFAFIVWRLGKMGVPFALRLAAFLYFALNPLCAVFSIVESKDTMFAAAFAVTTLLTIEMLCVPKGAGAVRGEPGAGAGRGRRGGVAAAGPGGGGRAAALAAVGFVTCMLRNNAAYAMVAAALIALVLCACRRLRRRAAQGAGADGGAGGFGKATLRYAKAMGATGAAALAVTAFAFPLMGIAPGFDRERLSVPAQQIAYTFIERTVDLTQEERDMTTNNILIGIRESYNPRFADPIKNYTRDWPSDGTAKGLMRHWLSLGLQYPKEYIIAFLTLNLGSWHTGMEVPDEYTQKPYIETDIQPDYGLSRDSKAPGLLRAYEGFATYADWQHVPFLSLLFDTGAPIWVIAAGIALALRKGRGKPGLLVFLLPLALWMTIMAGPLTNGRYAYPLILCYPLFLVAAFMGRRDCGPKAAMTGGEAAMTGGGPTMTG